MNIKIAIIAGLVTTCASVLHAEELSNTGQKTQEPEAKPEVLFRTIVWTNNMSLPEDGKPMLYDGLSNDSLHGFIMEAGDIGVSNEYQVVAVYREEDTKSEEEVTSPAITNATLRDVLEANGVYGWRYGPSHTNNNSAGAGQTHKNPIQILIIEPLNPEKDFGFTPDRIRIQEYRFDTDRQVTAWYEWINPRLFLKKWADYWVNGTDATPVALMVIAF